jgi:hypothetical protein
MADVFVSYSRRDTEAVQRLVEGLQARGKEVWLDVDGIRDAEVFPAALRRAVEGSDGFVFVISPDSELDPDRPGGDLDQTIERLLQALDTRDLTPVERQTFGVK